MKIRWQKNMEEDYSELKFYKMKKLNNKVMKIKKEECDKK